MTSINTNSSTAAATAATAATGNPALSGSMNQADFLKLLTTQLQTQDPTNPLDNSQFVSQLAQFSQLASTQDLNSTLNGLAGQISDAMQTSQVLSSATLVGRDVLVPSGRLSFDGSTALNGATSVTDAGRVSVTITDGAGEVVRTLDLGAQQPGLARFSWDGKDADGNPLPAGDYTLAATTADGSTTFPTYLAGTVTGVGYGGSNVGTYVQVAGVGGVPLDQIAQIN